MLIYGAGAPGKYTASYARQGSAAVADALHLVVV